MARRRPLHWPEHGPRPDRLVFRIGRSMRKCSLAIVFLLTVIPPLASIAHAQWAPLVSDSGAAKRIAWWREARFGMFLHWGVYSIPGRGEWVQWQEQIPVKEYAKLAEQFRADHYDPDAWARAAKDAGMKYMVLTARHHDGFALFDDPGSDFTAMKSAAHRDLVAEYVKAVRRAGLRVGLYYSPLDWRFPGFFFPGIYQQSAVEMRDQYQRQVEILGRNYGKIDILWFDGGANEWLGFGGVEFSGSGWHARAKDQPYRGKFDWQDEKTVAHLRELQPQILVNNRTDARADFLTREGDSAMGEFDNVHPWELCTTITDGAWGYQPNARVKPLAQLVGLLVGAAGRDGNLLLNVGPRPDGSLDPEQLKRLSEMGRWMRANGESIYGTRGGPWLPGKYGVSTHRGSTVYLHVLRRPADGVLELPVLSARVVSARVLHAGQIEFNQNRNTLKVTVPESGADASDTVIELGLSEPLPEVVKPISPAIER
jgi:alpha-L-fucosidase